MIGEKMNKKWRGGYSGRAGTGCALARIFRIFRAMRIRGAKKGNTIIYI